MSLPVATKVPGRRRPTNRQPRAHAAWLPPEAFRALGARRVLVHGDGLLVDTVLDEVTRACAALRRTGLALPVLGASDADLVLALRDAGRAARARRRRRRAPAGEAAVRGASSGGARSATRGSCWPARGGVTVVLADAPAGLLYGLFHLVRLGEAAFDPDRPPERHRPALRRRMLDHWDNVAVHPVMGQVERGYAGGSIFWRDGAAARRPGPGAGLRAAAGRLRGQRDLGEQRQRARAPRRGC